MIFLGAVLIVLRKVGKHFTLSSLLDYQYGTYKNHEPIGCVILTLLKNYKIGMIKDKNVFDTIFV